MGLLMMFVLYLAVEKLVERVMYFDFDDLRMGCDLMVFYGRAVSGSYILKLYLNFNKLNLRNYEEYFQ